MSGIAPRNGRLLLFSCTNRLSAWLRTQKGEIWMDEEVKTYSFSNKRHTSMLGTLHLASSRMACTFDGICRVSRSFGLFSNKTGTNRVRQQCCVDSFHSLVKVLLVFADVINPQTHRCLELLLYNVWALMDHEARSLTVNCFFSGLVVGTLPSCSCFH